MPDLPIDTLFIVGLLIASFVGKMLEGRKKKERERNKGTPRERPFNQEPVSDYEDAADEKGLGDLLKEAFGETIEPIPVRAEARGSIKEVPQQPDYNLDESIPLPSQTLKTVIPEKSWDVLERVDRNETRNWLKNEGLGSSQSLRRSFLVKVLLDKPPGLKRSGF
ncbi:hypothetical protein N9J83_05590 [Opitutales bacterium]|nr:hypothetical protein [Opitutales bacterium]